jgi:hypothetical protein
MVCHLAGFKHIQVVLNIIMLTSYSKCASNECKRMTNFMQKLNYSLVIVDMSEVELPGKAKQNHLPPKCGQLIDGGGTTLL